MRAPAAWAALLALALWLLAGCAADAPPPKPLEPLVPKIAGRMVWQAGIGRVDFPLAPAVRDGLVVVASSWGDVQAFKAETGELWWRWPVGAQISAGVGYDGRFSAVVTRNNEVVTLDRGREIWRARLPASVVTPPLVAGERVFVLAVDRAVHAFDALDGRRLWVLQRPNDPLTLAQPSVIGAFRNTLLVAQGPRLAAVDPLRGALQWEAAIATPRGSNEVERLADLVGPMVRVGDRVCMRAFQNAVGCADAARGATLWSRSNGGITSLAGDAERVFGADASDRVSAWRATTGDLLWTSERFLNRGFSGGVAVGPVVVFGDREGFVHFLSTETGEPQLRLPTDGQPVIGTPVVSGQTLVVTTAAGGLFAFRPN
ncbi:MAG: outer membrane protein assembly factor BamB [Betaproteobacteria bacterium]